MSLISPPACTRGVRRAAAYDAGRCLEYRGPATIYTIRLRYTRADQLTKSIKMINEIFYVTGRGGSISQGLGVFLRDRAKQVSGISLSNQFLATRFEDQLSEIITHFERIERERIPVIGVEPHGGTTRARALWHRHVLDDSPRRPSVLRALLLALGNGSPTLGLWQPAAAGSWWLGVSSGFCVSA